MRVLLVGEGRHEESALPTLVRRVCPDLDPPEFRRAAERRFRVHGKGRGVLKVALRWMALAQREGFDAVVVLVDEDGNRDRLTQIEDAQATELYLIQRACGLAIRTFDAWFLADEQALSVVLGRPISRQPDPEGIAAPKERCQRLCEEVANVGGLADLYARAAECMDLEILRNRCPQGWGVFEARLADLSTN